MRVTNIFCTGDICLKEDAAIMFDRLLTVPMVFSRTKFQVDYPIVEKGIRNGVICARVAPGSHLLPLLLAGPCPCSYSREDVSLHVSTAHLILLTQY